MKYLSSKPFTGGVNSDAYRANFERMFGKKEPEIWEPEGKAVKSEEADLSAMPTQEEWRDLWYRIDCRLELDRRNPERTDGTDSIRSWIVGTIAKSVDSRMLSISKNKYEPSKSRWVAMLYKIDCIVNKQVALDEVQDTIRASIAEAEAEAEKRASVEIERLKGQIGELVKVLQAAIDGRWSHKQAYLLLVRINAELKAKEEDKSVQKAVIDGGAAPIHSLSPIFLLVKWVGDQWVPVGHRCAEALFTSKEQALDFVQQQIPFANLRLYNVLDLSNILPSPD